MTDPKFDPSEVRRMLTYGIGVSDMDAAWDQLAAATKLLEEASAALQDAKSFIENGIALGFIRMPDADTPDSAHKTLPHIVRVLREIKGEKP